MTKFCSKCGEVKALELFMQGRNSCYVCVLASYKAYKEANREKIKASSKAYREANREKIKARYEANREKIKVKGKAYREANREKIAIRVKLYGKANRKKLVIKEKLCRDKLSIGYVTNQLRIKNPPKELIELKRVQLQITRELRNKPCQL